MDDGFQNSVARQRYRDPACRWPPRHRQRPHDSGGTAARAARAAARPRAGARRRRAGGAAPARSIDRANRRRMTIFHGRFEPDRAVVAAIGRRKVLAFAGIGDPEKFFATLTTAGIAGRRARKFSRSSPLQRGGSERPDRAARRSERLMLVTTEKDLMRLRGDPQLAALAERASALPVRLVDRRAGSVSGR